MKREKEGRRRKVGMKTRMNRGNEEDRNKNKNEDRRNEDGKGKRE